MYTTANNRNFQQFAEEKRLLWYGCRADDVLSSAVVCSSLVEALEGVHLVIGASARQRNIKWKQMDVLDTCNEIQKTLAKPKQQVAVIFGTENSGLTNEELDLCHILMTIPGNPDYFSLGSCDEVACDSYDYNDLNGNGTFDADDEPLCCLLLIDVLLLPLDWLLLVDE